MPSLTRNLGFFMMTWSVFPSPQAKLNCDPLIPGSSHMMKEVIQKRRNKTSVNPWRWLVSAFTKLTEITNFFGISTTVFDNFWMEASHWEKKLRVTGLFMRYAFLYWSTVSRLRPQGCCCRSQTCLCVELLVDRQLGKHSDRPESLFFPTRDTWDTRFNLQCVRLTMSTWFKFAEMLPSVWLLCYLSRPLLAWLKLARAVWTEWIWMCVQFLTIPRIDLFKPYAGFTCICPAALVFNQCAGCLRMVVIFIFKWLGFETYITDVSNMLFILICEHNTHCLDNFENFMQLNGF